MKLRTVETKDTSEALESLDFIQLPAVLSVPVYYYVSQETDRVTKIAYTKDSYIEIVRYFRKQHSDKPLRIQEAAKIMNMTNHQINWALYGLGALVSSTAIGIASGSFAAFLGVVGASLVGAAVVRAANGNL